VRFLARRLGRPASAFRLVRGAAARDKVLRVVGVSAAAVRASLEPPAREVGA